MLDRVPRPSSSAHRPRGSTLIIVTILLATILVIAVGALAMSGLELGAAASKKRRDVLIACARGGKELLISQFRFANAQPTSISAHLGGTGSDLLVASGHYDSASLPEVGEGLTYEFKPLNMAGSPRGPEDIANKITGGGATHPTEYTIVCQDGSGNRYELEFALQFGF